MSTDAPKKLTRQVTLVMRVMIVVAALSMFSLPAHAIETEELLTACTYGTVTGTLIGTASLAFTKRPGDHFNRIARGASLGLYAGIILGLYVATLPGDSRTAQFFKDINVMPTTSLHGIDGASATYTLYQF